MATRSLTQLSESDIAAFDPVTKVGIVATTTAAGLPHLTLLTSLMAKSPTELIIGQFSEGLSKVHMRERPDVGWLVMDQRGAVWRGTARWTGSRTEGPDYELFNRKRMFRYNTYFGIHTVHYLDLIEHTGRKMFPVGGLVTGLPLTAAARLLARRAAGTRLFKPWARAQLDNPLSFKFLGFVGADGRVRVTSPIAAQVAGDGVVFARTVDAHEIGELADGTSVALFAMNMKGQSVMCRGPLRRVNLSAGLVCAIDVDYVYNSMPPKQGQIYPPRPLEAVTQF